MSSPLIRVPCDLLILLFLLPRVRPLQTEISLINANVLYKRVNSAVHKATLLSAVFQNNQIKIILMPKRYILEWHILLLFNVKVILAS